MSLVFGANATTRVTCTADPRLTSQSMITAWAWVYPTSLVALSLIFWKRRAATPNFQVWQLQLNGTGGNMQAAMIGSTNCNAIVSSTPLATLNKWYFVAVTFEFGVAARVYVGDMTTMISECSYSSQTAGATIQSDATFPLVIGNRDGADRPWNGRIGPCGVQPGVVLSLEQLRVLQFNPRGSSAGPHYRLGDNGINPQTDYSGGDKNGIITAAVEGPFVPLGYPLQA